MPGSMENIEGGMELITLEDNVGLSFNFSADKNKARENLYNIEAKALPHYSILFDMENARAAMDDGLAHILTDKAGNTIIIGYADCMGGNPDGECNCSGTHKVKTRVKVADAPASYSEEYKNNVRKTNPTYNKSDDTVEIEREEPISPSPFRAMLCASIFNMGFSKETIMRQATQFSRDTGGGSLEADTLKFLGEGGQWRNMMLQREQEGKSPVPYLYIKNDTKIITLSTFFEEYAAYLILIAALIATAFIGPLSAGLLGTAFKSLTGIAFKYAQTGILTLKDLGEVAISLAPSLAPASKNGTSKILGFDTKILEKLASDGSKMYNSVLTGNYKDIADVFGVSGKSDISQIVNMASKKDISGLAKFSGLPVNEVEKQVQSYKNSEMIAGLVYEYDKIKTQTEAVGNGLLHAPIRQYVQNVAANNEIAPAIPNSIGAMQILVNNTNINANELKAITSTFQGQKAMPNSLNRLQLLAFIEEAKQNMKKGVKGFVLPANTPSELVGEYAYIIQGEVKGSYVIPADMFSHNYVEFG